MKRSKNRMTVRTMWMRMEDQREDKNEGESKNLMEGREWRGGG